VGRSHGAPDDSNVVKTGVAHRIDDMAELAARRRSPDVWDRRGDVLFLTDFREGLGPFHSEFSGDGGGIALVTGHSRQGAYSIRLRPGQADDMFAYLHLAFPFQDPSPVGFEFSFSVAEWTAQVRVEIVWYDGANERTGLVIYDHENKELRYYREPATETVLDPHVDLNECFRPEHSLKLVVDMATNQYVRFMLDDRTYGVFDYPVDEVPDPRAPYWYFVIWHFGVALHNPDCYIDNVIVTQNEPV